jgi:hypothetical protein
LITGPTFVWLHFPKTAGHTVDLALRVAARRMRGFVFDRRGDYHPGWHDVVAERSERDPRFDPTGKVVVSAFRRLPYWLLSRIHYEAAKPPFRVATREMVVRGEFFESDGGVSSADGYARRYAGDVQRWIRVEHLRSDFERCFADLLPARSLDLALANLDQVRNSSPIGYLPRTEFYFTPKELAELYCANPIWSALEKRLYGALLSGPALFSGPTLRSDRRPQQREDVEPLRSGRRA